MKTAEVVTTVTTPYAQGYNLIDLATVKDELSINNTDTSNDAFLNRSIAQISTAIANHCNRVFPVEGLTDVFYSERRVTPHQRTHIDEVLQLTRWPLMAVTSVVETASDGTKTTLVSGTDYIAIGDVGRVSKNNIGQLVRLNSDTGFPARWKVPEVSVAYAAGFGSALSEAHTVPSSGPYTVTVTDASSFALDLGVTGNSHPYTVNNSTGVYTFNSADAGVSVTINYAHTQIPDDIVDAVLRMITGRWWSRKRDPMLVQRDQPGGVGMERFWIPAHDGVFPPEIAGLLDGIYRVPVVG